MKTMFIVGYTSDIAKKLVESLNSSSNQLKIVKISGRDNLEIIQKQIEDNFDVDGENIMINFIGAGFYGMFDEIDISDIEKNFEANFWVPLKILKLFVNIVKSKSIGNNKKLNCLIYNINSKAVLEPFSHGIGYNSSKAAISMALKVIGKEYSKYGLKTKEVYPGVIQTKMLDKMPYIPKSGVQPVEDFVKEILGDKGIMGDLGGDNVKV